MITTYWRLDETAKGGERRKEQFRKLKCTSRGEWRVPCQRRVDDACQFLSPSFARSFSGLSAPLSSSVVYQNVVGRECNGLARMIARPDEAAIFCTGAGCLTPEINRIFRAARHRIEKKGKKKKKRSVKKKKKRIVQEERRTGRRISRKKN